MNLAWIDWFIIGVLIVALGLVACRTKRYTKSVSGFLAANRCGGRYLLTMAEGMTWVGAITIVASFEQRFQVGFCATWWYLMITPIGVFLALSGWVIYRYRQTRALTMAQFFEMRYSRKFRIFAGLIAWLSGVINYGIFPAVTARFFIYFVNIPQHKVMLGPLELNLTLGVIMAAFLGVALVFALNGGQIAIMITDFLQGQFCNVVFLLITIFLLVKFGWSNILDTLKQAPAGESMLNPFDQTNLRDFTFAFFAMTAFNNVYSYMAWQGSQGYYCSAKSPHEARMGRVLGMWRAMISMIVLILVPVCAYVMLNGSAFPEQAEAVRVTIDALGNSTLEKQLTVPIALSKMLPAGLLGLFCFLMIAAAVSTDDTYLHSWGSIFIQDVYIPLRNQDKPLSPEKHLKLLRWSIVLVAVFAWFFSMLFPLKDYILMFMALTGAIFIGGAGSVIIGGLYWRRGTTAGAWAGMIVGSLLSVTSVLLINVVWPKVLPVLRESHPGWQWLQRLPQEFPLSGMAMAQLSSLAAILAYVAVSLLTKSKAGFDLDRMLHRGKYASEQGCDSQRPRSLTSKLWRALGISEEFTWGDKAIYFFALGSQLFWLLVFICGTIYAKTTKTTNDQWGKFWTVYLSYTIAIAVITTVWFMWGGFRDMVDLFQHLKNAKINADDDGRVEEREASEASKDGIMCCEQDVVAAINK